MSQNQIDVATQRVLRTRKADPLLTVGFAAGVGMGSALVYKAFMTAAPMSNPISLIGGTVLLVIGVASLLSGGWRPMFL